MSLTKKLNELDKENEKLHKNTKRLIKSLMENKEELESELFECKRTLKEVMQVIVSPNENLSDKEQMDKKLEAFEKARKILSK